MRNPTFPFNEHAAQLQQAVKWCSDVSSVATQLATSLKADTTAKQPTQIMLSEFTHDFILIWKHIWATCTSSWESLTHTQLEKQWFKTYFTTTTARPPRVTHGPQSEKRSSLMSVIYKLGSKFHPVFTIYQSQSWDSVNTENQESIKKSFLI